MSDGNALDQNDFCCLLLKEHDQVLTVQMRSQEQMSPEERRVSPIHWELGELFARLRGVNSVRVVVLTGAIDGIFLRPLSREGYAEPEMRRAQIDPGRMWRVFTGTTRFHECIAELEKPVVACVNGDAVGLGQSVMFACDLIVARDDAVVRDHHLDENVVPGDGGAALVPAFFSPARAKEYLMLSREYRARELADLGVINRAVPAERLTAEVDAVVSQLLARSSYALAWTKRAANRLLVSQMQAGLDAAAGYEMVNFYQNAHLDWQRPDSLG